MPWINDLSNARSRLITGVSLLTLLLMIVACGNIPEAKDGRTMRDIYEQQMIGGAQRGHAQGSDSATPASARPAEDAVPPRYSAYTRSVRTEIENLFPALPNPTLFLYIRPHTVGTDQIPVPGYTVPVKMYERDQHAMPGEVVPAETDAWTPTYDALDWGLTP